MAETNGAGLPRVLADTSQLAHAHDAAGSGAVFRLTMDPRDLDANVIALPPGGTIEEHVGPDLDVLLHVASGAGVLATDGGDVPLAPGAVVWLPRRSRRAFSAGPEGLMYLSVHVRKPGLGLSQRPPG
jgi:quercetin dioxygenase-like cupin family protein